MKWKLPPKIKIYEALGCIGDERIELQDNGAKVFSSSRGKFYLVLYDKEKNAIMSNDNGSYWVGYIGYPSIAFLMLKEKIKYNPKFAEALKDIVWKEANVNFKNDYDKTEKYILEIVTKRGYNTKELTSEIEQIFEQIMSLNINVLGKKTKPPSAH